MNEEIYDIDSAEKMWLTLGDIFYGWYFLKTPEPEKKELVLGWKDLSYKFTVCDFNYRFIMPETFKCGGGNIVYSKADQLFGVFRFPIKGDGTFVLPEHHIDSDEALYRSVHPEQFPQVKPAEEVKLPYKLINPVVFEAYRIPQFGFNFIDLTEADLEEISKITNKNFAIDIKSNYTNMLEKKIVEVREKIGGQPNFLLILKTLLEKNSDDLKEVARITNNIINE